MKSSRGLMMRRSRWLTFVIRKLLKEIKKSLLWCFEEKVIELEDIANEWRNLISDEELALKKYVNLLLRAKIPLLELSRILTRLKNLWKKKKLFSLSLKGIWNKR